MEPTINLSILDFKPVMYIWQFGVGDAINLSILDFKLEFLKKF